MYDSMYLLRIYLVTASSHYVLIITNFSLPGSSEGVESSTSAFAKGFAIVYCTTLTQFKKFKFKMSTINYKTLPMIFSGGEKTL